MEKFSFKEIERISELFKSDIKPINKRNDSSIFWKEDEITQDIVQRVINEFVEYIREGSF